MMRTCGLLPILLLVAHAPATAQQAPDWGKIQLKAAKVAGTIYMVDKLDDGTDSFAGGNVTVSVGPDGIILVDAMFAPLAPKLRAVLKPLSDKPVKFVVNTHVHGDHTNGNAAFGGTATIIAHANTRKQLSTQGPDPEDKPEPRVAWPVITVNDRLTLHQNGESVRILHLPNAHSDTDVVVFFEQSNVVSMGDIYFSGMFPFIGRGGTVAGLVAGIEKVLSEIPIDAKLIPGHGPLSTAADLRSTLAMLKETSAIVENGIKRNASLEQMTREKVLAKYDSWADGYINTDQYLEQLYKVLTR